MFCSLLHLAVIKQDVILVEEIIAKGADVNARDINTGDTCLHLLMNVYTKNHTNSFSILQLLAKSGADINLMNFD